MIPIGTISDTGYPLFATPSTTAGALVSFITPANAITRHGRALMMRPVHSCPFETGIFSLPIKRLPILDLFVFASRHFLDTLCQARESLRQSVDCAVGFGNVVALCRAWEHHAKVDPRFVSLRSEDDRRPVADWLVAVTWRVLEDQPFRLLDFAISNCVGIVAPIGAMHDEPPYAARLYIYLLNGRGESLRPPPVRNMSGIGEHLPDQIAVRIHDANTGNLAIALQHGNAVRRRVTSQIVRPVIRQVIGQTVEALIPAHLHALQILRSTRGCS